LSAAFAAAYRKLLAPPQQKPMVAIEPRRTAGWALRYANTESRLALTSSGVSSAVSLRPESCAAGDGPNRGERRSGTIATYPEPASRSATVGSQSVSPKISWMTITAPAGSFRSG
jgi:hypothetical protein